MKKWNLDVIHTHTEFGIGTFARVIGKQFDIPVVHTYHTMYEDYVHYITKRYFKKSSRLIPVGIVPFVESNGCNVRSITAIFKTGNSVIPPGADQKDTSLLYGFFRGKTAVSE